MKGHLWVAADAPKGRLPLWEELAIDAVGNVIDFWGFKRNDGRVWALLYLRGQPMSAAEIQEDLALSKGAVSMLTRELEHWGVVERVRAAGDSTWQFAAETELLRMVGRVIREREVSFVSRVRADLGRAQDLAERDSKVEKQVLDRLGRMLTLASMIDGALKVFVETACLDVGSVAAVLREVAGAPFRRARKPR